MGSLLDLLVEPELRAVAEFRFEQNAVSIGVNGETKYLDFSLPYADEDLELFHVWCVKPPTSAESSGREVRDRGRALGHIFPITSFNTDSEFSADNLPNRFQQIFASVAAKAIVVLGVANIVLSRKFFELGERAPLSDIFDSDAAIVVVGKENLRAANVDLSTVQLMLQEQGYFLAELPVEFGHTRVRPESEGNCHIGRISGDLLDFAEAFTQMTCLASQQSSAVASVLIYYQILEVVSEKLLSTRLSRLAAAPPPDSWGFKEALRDAVSEKSRIISLCIQAAVLTDAPIFLELRDDGIRLLQECGQNFDENDSPGAVLYKVRNIVVHNQGALNVAAHGILNAFADDLHRIVFAIVRRFNLMEAR